MKRLVVLYATPSMATGTLCDYEFSAWKALDELVAVMFAATPARTATTTRAAHA